MQCKECQKTFEQQSFGRHVKVHEMTFQEYVFKWKHNSIRPICNCGCGVETNWNVSLKDFAEHVLGHHAFGRKKSDEEKAKIGSANSKNMTRYMNQHPEIAKLKNKQLRSCITKETEKRRLESTKRAYSNMSNEEKKKFSENGKRLWNEQHELMLVAHQKAAKTFNDKFALGEYDFTERNDKISEKITQMYLDGGFAWSRGSYTSSKTGKTCHFRSSWERIFMEQLDKDDNVVTWEYEFDSIKYEFNGHNKRYIPDFYVITSKDGNELRLLIEVKPMSLNDTKMNLAKREAALKYCAERGLTYKSWSFVSGFIDF